MITVTLGTVASAKVKSSFDVCKPLRVRNLSDRKRFQSSVRKRGKGGQ